MAGRGQASMEYLLVAGFAFVVTIPIIIAFYLQSGNINDDINMNQINQIGRKIIDASESVFYLGSPSQTTLKVYMPPKIQKISVGKDVGGVVEGREIVFNVETQSSTKDVVLTSRVLMRGNISVSSGIHHLQIRSDQSYVNITDLDLNH